MIIADEGYFRQFLGLKAKRIDASTGLFENGVKGLNSDSIKSPEVEEGPLSKNRMDREVQRRFKARARGHHLQCTVAQDFYIPTIQHIT